MTDINTKEPTVRERVKAQLRANVAAFLADFGITDQNVQRWNRKGNKPVGETGDVPPDNFHWCLIQFGESDLDDENPTDREGFVLPFDVELHINQRDDDEHSTDEFGERWLGVLHQAVMSDPDLEETDTEIELGDVKVIGQYGPDSGSEETEVIVGIEGEIQFRHPEADPYTVG